MLNDDGNPETVVSLSGDKCGDQQTLYESLRAAEKAEEAGEGLPFTPQ